MQGRARAAERTAERPVIAGRVVQPVRLGPVDTLLAARQQAGTRSVQSTARCLGIRNLLLPTYMVFHQYFRSVRASNRSIHSATSPAA